MFGTGGQLPHFLVGTVGGLNSRNFFLLLFPGENTGEILGLLHDCICVSVRLDTKESFVPKETLLLQTSLMYIRRITPGQLYKDGQMLPYIQSDVKQRMK